jgi:hypothetical protein
MFDETTPVPTTLTPGPNWQNTFDPATHKTPVKTLDRARAHAHQQARPYFLWDDLVLIAVSPHQHLVTGLRPGDVQQPPPGPA